MPPHSQTARIRRPVPGSLALVLAVWLGTALAQPPPSPELLAKYQAAQEAFSSGRFQEAAPLYQALVEALPEVAGLKMNWGMALYLSGQPGPAVDPLRQAVKGDPELVPAWFFLGVSLLDIGKPSDAVAPLQEYVRRNPTEVKGIEALGDALLRIGSADTAKVEYLRAVKLDPRSPQAWYGLGRCYEALAGQAFAKLDESAPESAYWLALIAESREAHKQHLSAFFLYRQALERQPDLRGIHAAIAKIYRDSGHAEWAAQEAAKEDALGIPDCSREPLVCLFLEGKLEDLLVKSAASATPEGWYWQVKASNLLALQAFRRLDELPPSVEGYLFRAENERSQGRPWESVDLLQKALEMAPGHPVVERELALSLYLKRDYDSAKALVQRLLQTDPGSSMLNYLAGEIRLYQQNIEEALGFLENAVRLDPGHIGSHSALGRAYMQLGEAEKAIPHLKAALSEDEEGSLRFQLARAYQRTGQAELARQTMAEYQKLQQQHRAQQREVEEQLQITPP